MVGDSEDGGPSDLLLDRSVRARHTLGAAKRYATTQGLRRLGRHAVGHVPVTGFQVECFGRALYPQIRLAANRHRLTPIVICSNPVTGVIARTAIPMTRDERLRGLVKANAPGSQTGRVSV